LVSGAWVGGEDRQVHFNSIKYGQGASMALPIWGLFMQKCYADETLDVSKGKFDKPEELTINTDCSKTELSKEDKIEDEKIKDELEDIDF